MYVIYVRCHMKRVRVNEDIRPMSEFRNGIASFLKQIHDTKRPMIITQHGKGVAVLLDAGEYEAMQEKIELLQDIQTSIGQIEAGHGVDHDQAKRAILNRIRK
jgi:antitoxin YefM